MAGMRNAASVVRRWPALVEALEPVGALLREKIERVPSFQGLAGCCGADPSRPPPSETLLGLLRSQVEEVLGLPRGSAQECHPAAPWKFNIVDKVVRNSLDSDIFIADWLKHGAPMGLAVDIQEGGLFPRQEETPEIGMDELAVVERWSRNHPSFAEDFGHDRPPGLDLLEEYLEELVAVPRTGLF